MSSWTEVVEEGQVFWVNNELGNVVKIDDKSFVAMMPMICRLGPFSSLEEAKSVLTRKKEIKDLIEEYNNSILK